jgi:endonuclease YncB( thermonuclease family)
VREKEVDLAVVDLLDEYGRLVAVMYVGDVDISAQLLRGGYAWAYREFMRYEDLAYCDLEADARSRARGLWSLEPIDRVAPWQWRSAKVTYLADYSNETAANCSATVRGSGTPPPPLYAKRRGR